MLKQRILSSAVLIAATVALMALDFSASPSGAEGIWLVPLLLFFTLGTGWEVSTLLRKSGRLVSRRAPLVATAVVVISVCIPLLWPLIGAEYPPDCPVGGVGWIVIGTVLAVFGMLISEMLGYGKRPGAGLERALAGIFVAVYAGLPMALFVSIRMLGEGNWGLAALVTTIATTKSTDAGAFFVGRKLGRHKLMPQLSPGKTLEGAVGGILTATVVAAVCLAWLFPWLTSTEPDATPAPVWWTALALGPVLAISGMIGDLAESLVKRDTGAKDSGTWLPGLGGVWDVTDSLIAAVMPAFLFFAAVPAG